METKENILIVDDDLKTRKILSDILNAKGYAPTMTGTGKDALSSIYEKGFSVALIDLKLGDMSGLEVMKEIKENSLGTECILITGHASRESAIEAINLGAYSYMQKPYDMDQLLLTVQRAIEKQKAEEALRESEKKYRLLVKNLPSIVYKGYKDWSVEFFDSKIESLTGYNKDEFNTKKIKWSDIIVKEDVENAKTSFIQALKTDKSYAREYRIKSKAGDLHWIQERGQIICDNRGEIEYISGVFFDITERKRADEERKALEARLQQVQKMEAIGTLAGGIAHDFNNILYPIIGYTEMSIEDLPEDNIIRSNMLEVLKAAKRARNLVKQILIFSRQSELEKKPIQVLMIVKEVLMLLRASFPSTINITKNIASSSVVKADPTQIHQMIMNLCTNAFHAMEETGGELTVTLSDVEIGSDNVDLVHELEPGVYQQLSVSDTGCGMEPAVIERIFEPYFTTKEKDKGTGMGLAATHGIVKSHNGYITVNSEPGKGTAFHVYLPVIKSQAETEELDAIEPVPIGTERILLVDDEDSIVRMEKQMLERLGYHVTARTSSPDALEAFRASPGKFDLVITDMTMPNMTGVQLSQKLLEIRYDIPIIICTGFSTKIDGEKAKAAGIRGYVMKPVVMSEIAKKIREVLDQN